MKIQRAEIKLLNKKESDRSYSTLMNVKLSDPKSDFSAYLRIQRDESMGDYFIYMTNSNGYVLQRINRTDILLLRDMLNLTIDHNRLSQIGL